MKKTRFYLMIATTALLLVGCGGSSKVEKGGEMIYAAANISMDGMGGRVNPGMDFSGASVNNVPANSGPKYYGDDYESACKDINFEAAHKILNELGEEGYSSNFTKARDYIYTAEVAYLLNTFPIEDARPKIMFLLQECDKMGAESYIKLCGKICTLIISSGNNDFAIEVLKTLANKYESERHLEEYFTCFQTVYKAQIDHIIKNFAGKESVAKVALLMQNIPVEGDKIVADGVYRYYDILSTIDPNIYMYWYVNYNQLCDYILASAINNQNKDLGKAVLMLYLDDIEVIEPVDDDYGNYKKIHGVVVDGDHVYLKLNKKSFNEAKKKYDNAVALGLLTE